VIGAVRAGDALMVKASNGSKMGPLVKALERQFPRRGALAPAEG
jgi:UDP-N-acetylmuramoyl-tripeptide--D-alanyl-D-alanine ligase